MSILDLAIGWLAPAECISCNVEGTPLCPACRYSEVIPYGDRCFKCNKLSPSSKTCTNCKKLGAPAYVWITTDYQGIAKELIQSLKFKHQRSIAAVIAKLMHETFTSNVARSDINKLDYLIVPIPTATSRVRERSFDHTELIAAKFKALSGVQKTGSLKRLGQTRQVGAKRSARLTQSKNVYYVSNKTEISGRNILLIDDVTTTGATLEDAARVLRKTGAKRVDALVLAKKL